MFTKVTARRFNFFPQWYQNRAMIYSDELQSCSDFTRYLTSSHNIAFFREDLFIYYSRRRFQDDFQYAYQQYNRWIWNFKLSKANANVETSTWILNILRVHLEVCDQHLKWQTNKILFSISIQFFVTSKMLLNFAHAKRAPRISQ